MSDNFKSLTLCRSFTLFNNKILSDYYVGDNNSCVPENFQYLAIGFFDAFNTEIVMENTIKEDKDSKEENKDTGERKFKKLYEHIQNLSVQLNGEQSYQNVYGFIDESKSDKVHIDSFECSDKQFWENKDKHLIFVSFWQMGNVKFGQTIQKIKNILNNKKYNNSEIPFIAYSTLDKSDFIICFKSDNYKDVTLLINQLYIQLQNEKIQTIYSYTNLIVNNCDDDGDFDSNEKIDSICIKTVLNNFSDVNINCKIKAFCNKLSDFIYGESDGETKQKEKNVVGYEILGDTDCRFIARKVPLVKILNLFSENGLLHRTNDDFKYCFLSSMTSLNVDCSDNRVDMKMYAEQVEKYITKRKDDPKKTSKVEELQKTVGEINNSKYFSVKTSLLNLLHCLRSMELSINQKSEFEILFSPVKTTVKLLIDIIGDKEKEKNRYISELLSYIDKIYIIMQGAMRTDIRLYQILDYSVMSYYAPSKLRIFYSLFIKKISEYYEKLCPSDNHKYEFIIFHSTNIDITVEQVWRDNVDEDKLMTVNIPECKLYDIKTAIFTLAHEVAHFVGNEDIRKREYRFKAIIKTMAKRHYKNCCYEIKNVLDRFINSNYKNVDCCKDAFEKRMKFSDVYERQEESIFNEYNESIIHLLNNKDGVKTDKYSMFYSVNIFEVFEISCTEKLVELISTPLLDSINTNLHMNILKCTNSECEDFELYNNFMNECNKSIKRNNKKYSYEEIYMKNSFLEDILYVVSESYADLSAIILLNLKIEDYINFIKKTIENELNGASFNSMTIDEFFDIWAYERIFVRCCIVIVALYDANKKTSKTEIDYSIIHSNSFDDFKLKLNFDENDDNSIFENAVIKYIKDGYILDWEYICDYLKECAISFDLKSNEMSKKIRSKIIEIYKNTTSNDLIKCINSINNFINDSTDN